MDSNNNAASIDTATLQPTKIGQWIISPSSEGIGGLMLSGFSMSQDIHLLTVMGIGAVLSIVVQNELEHNRYEPPIVGRFYEV